MCQAGMLKIPKKNAGLIMKSAPHKSVRYSVGLFDAICEEMAHGKSLSSICVREDMPSYTSVMNWLRMHVDDGVLEKYARAREIQADYLADEIIDIADDGSRDYKASGEDGAPVVDLDHIARSRLRIDARKWAASKIAPKKYGEKIIADVNSQSVVLHRMDLSELPDDARSALRAVLSKQIDATEN